MEEMLNVVNDTQLPVVAADEPENSDTEVCQTEITPRQSPAENSAFRKLRLENERLRAENEQYAAQDIERRMKEDLAAIRSIDPQVTSLAELGEDFESLVAAGIDAPLAFRAVRQMMSAAEPPEMGPMDGSGSKEKDFYSPEEVDALTSAQLSDPKVWQKVRKSMTKW